MSRLFNAQALTDFKTEFSEKILSEAYSGKSSLKGKELLSLTPCRQVNFFVMKALFQQWQAEMRRLESPYFNYKSAEVRKAMNQFMNVLSQSIEVKMDDLRPLLIDAVEESLVIIVNPADFIKKEFAQKEDVLYAEKQSKTLLKYIKVLEAEFEDFFQAQAKGTYREVFEIAEDYFADVDLTTSQDEMLAQLSNVVPVSMEELLEQEEFLDVMDFDEEVEMEEDEPAAASTTVEDNEETVEDNEEKEEQPAPIITQNEEVQDHTPQEQETINDQFTEGDTSTLVEQMSDTNSAKGILHAVSVNQQYMFTQELFRGNANDFQKSMAEIDQFNSFDEGVEHLVSGYAKRYDWDMNSEEVKELLKVIFRRFR